MANAVHLAYHYVRDGVAPGPTCPPRRLRYQLEYLKNNRYEVLTCGEVADRMRTGKPLPPRYATLSFDDGLADQRTTALPILREFSVPATFFVIACTLAKKLPPVIGFQILIDQLGAGRLEKEILPKVFAGTPYLDLLDPKLSPCVEDTRKTGEPRELRRIKWMFNHWPSQAFRRDRMAEMFNEYLGSGVEEEFAERWFIGCHGIAELHRAGMEVASHSLTHPPFDVSGIAEIREECISAKQALADLLEEEPRTFAWTFGGRYRPAVREEVMRHYQSAWNFLKLASVPEGPHDLSDMPRLHEELAELS